MGRSWIWMALFSVIFLALGVLELSTGVSLAGARMAGEREGT